jgi:signal transduction histidine kinase
MLGVNTDITHRKDAAEQLRALSASLIHAQEEERRRISRELHDDLTQRLGLMAIDLGRLHAQVPASLPPVAQELRFLQQRAIETAQLTRHIAHELHPSILEELGIELALRSDCEEFTRREEIPISFNSANLPQTIRREAASCLHAVAREALLNISKHARAAQVTVELAGHRGGIRLTIADNGIGFARDVANASLGLGVVNMRERVRWMNGAFTIESEPGRGTKVTVTLPE